MNVLAASVRAKFASVQAVLNCASVPVIPTIEVWSPVLLPDRASPLSFMSFPVVQLNVTTLLATADAGHSTLSVLRLEKLVFIVVLNSVAVIQSRREVIDAIY